ncbi:hypothetical protein LTR85_007323 [Meristemomyces frigidus]|nr:hypothetical protein LTR85_007323 [Meristemomyces frigidus]
MARQRGRILPFRIPFFRIFYSTTYTILYIIILCLLAITPSSIIWTAVENHAYQYTFMIGAVYLLTALISIFIYSSRLYTNRTVLAGVGKAYIPVEEGEVSKSVRKMIVKQLERSAIVAWESKPRDLVGEILQAETLGLLPPETQSVDHNDYTVGRVIAVDPASPPWGCVDHPGWTSPSHRDDNKNPNVECLNVVAELPNLIEARAVSLAPPDPAMTPMEGQAVADPAVVQLLCRPQIMGMRDYLTQLSYLGLVNPPAVGQDFLRQYEKARFCGRPITEADFGTLMATFAELLSGVTELSPEIVEQIRAQMVDIESEAASLAPPRTESAAQQQRDTPSPSRSPGSSLLSPVTAREALSRSVTPYLQQGAPSMESFSSVIHNTAYDDVESQPQVQASGSSSLDSASLASLPSDAGSVVWHGAATGDG